MRDDDVRRDVMCVSTGAVVQLLQAAVQLCVCVCVCVYVCVCVVLVGASQRMRRRMRC